MYRLIIIGMILFSLLQNAGAQDRKALANEITNKMSFMKNGYAKRQIEFKDDSIYGTPFLKIISMKNLGKDSLRHLLVVNGFSDSNFEFFNFKIKKTEELDEAFIKDNNPQLFKFLSDRTFNKVTYSFLKSADGIEVSLVLSENDILIDNTAEIHSDYGPGVNARYITVSGYSHKKSISFYVDRSYTDIIRNNKTQGLKIDLNEKNRFKLNIDVSTPNEKYVSIRDSTGKILSMLNFRF